MPLPTEPNPEELTQEKNLWELYRSSNALPKSTQTAWLKYSIITVLTAYAIGTATIEGWGYKGIITSVRGWASDGLSFSSQVIGFVLAGFTIFATMNTSTFTITLARHREPKTTLPFIKYIYLSFMRVFALYVGFIGFCLIIRLLGEPNGVASFAIGTLPSAWHDTTKQIISRMGFVVLGSWFWFIVIDLYSFMFNVYHTVMSSVRWELERKPEQAGPSSQPQEEPHLSSPEPPQPSMPSHTDAPSQGKLNNLLAQLIKRIKRTSS
ncbi:hypothetical protein [Myxococcus sp. CA040A]|uniref:hypothetical protein n=1 Tax=Myxococcus sp. CA040A TaxID=2741738 RepID=UPI00157B53BD|nr:hypothetical protein [Myxococcus sp. CA040A]NTX06279.1 hypothetical protein [Myxococcus sp. CA040A]